MSKNVNLTVATAKNILELLGYVEFGLLSDADDKVIDYRHAGNELRGSLKSQKESDNVELSRKQAENILELLEYVEFGLLSDTDSKVIDYRDANNKLRAVIKG